MLRVTHRDPEARLLVMPSDHWVRDEDVLQRALEASLGEVERWLDHVILLGEVVAFERGPGAALLFHDGAYCVAAEHPETA